MVGAIILAAGSSKRMGSPKPLLLINGKTFIQHIADQLLAAGIGEIVAVLGPEKEKILASMEWYRGLVVVNERWTDGQISSLLLGLEALEATGVEGVLICPVDRPIFSPALVTGLVDGFTTSHKGIVVPAYHGKRGHPVLFARRMFRALRSVPPHIGARGAIWANPGEVLELPTEEPGVTMNIDTPEAYRAGVENGTLR